MKKDNDFMCNSNNNITSRPTMSYWTDEMIKFMVDASIFTKYNVKLASLIGECCDNKDSICDFGCGLGFLSLELSKIFNNVTSIDINEKPISVFKEYAKDVSNINILNQDANTLSSDIKFDNVLFNYFGKSEQIIELSKKHAKCDIIIVLRNNINAGFTLESGVTRTNHLSIYDYLESNNIKYDRNDYSIEFGQPFESLEDAAQFFNIYKLDSEKIFTVNDIIPKVSKIYIDKFKYYYQHSKDISILKIEAKNI